MSKETEWMKLVKQVKFQQPNKSLKDILKIASSKYKKRKLKGGAFEMPLIPEGIRPRMKLPKKVNYLLE